MELREAEFKFVLSSPALFTIKKPPVDAGGSCVVKNELSISES
jgi:hypothetical protein